MANKIDFSKLERLTPRADSWDKVCKRLDATAKATPAGKIISIKAWYSAIPIAASIALVSLTVLLPALSHTSATETISINSSAPSEVMSWYSSLGNSTSDDFETLEETVGFSYLIKE